MTSAKKTVFVIGFPGAVARNVAVELALTEGTMVRLLTSKKHLKEASKFASSPKGDISIVEGSLSKIDFGLTGEDYLELAGEVGSIVYCDLPLPPGASSLEPGTRIASREIIEFALAAARAPRIVFLSHFDVAGDTPGVFAEQDLVLGQSFSGKADEDRFRAERVFSRFIDKLPITIIRSGWVVGHGEGICPLVELLLAQEDLQGVSPKALECTIPFIDVGSISKLIAGITEAEFKGENLTLHVAYEGIPKLSELYEMVQNLAEEALPMGFDYNHGAKVFLRQTEPELRWSAREFIKHIGDGTRFTNARTKRVLRDTGLTQPNFEDSFRSLMRDATTGFIARRR